MYAEIDAREELLELWQTLANDLGSTERFEITEHGEIVLSPRPAGRHQAVISVVMGQLVEQLGGHALPEVSIVTRSVGIRCPDVIWLPPERFSETFVDGPMETVPPLVVEVLSPTNRRAEMAHKIRGYLESGAQEVAVVGLNGELSFYREDGAHPESLMGITLELPAELFA